MQTIGLIVFIMICLGTVCFIGVTAAAEEVRKITPEQLKTMLGDPDKYPKDKTLVFY
jgi:hypothetical protein